jgi:hypothetical protein
MLDTPVLFIIFNRPDCTKAVFAQIRKAKPRQLFIAADGPRKYNITDVELCEKTRKITEKIDWDCEVKTLFRDENLGCAKSVSGAITWFLEHVEQGIILEDDCLPHPTFFKFCEDTLNFYKDDLTVFNVSGSNSQFGRVRGDGSYYFSKYGHIWGWATWRRAWKGYDIDILDYPNIIQSSEVEPYWKNIFFLTYNKKIDTWDYQWFFHLQKNKAKVVVPNRNLILNIGFQSNATHTNTLPKWHKNYRLDTEGITDIIHPSSTDINKKADEFTFRVKFTEKATLKSITKKILLYALTDAHIQRLKSLFKLRKN